MTFKAWLGVDHSYIVILSIGLTLLASFFLIKGKITLSVDDIAELSMTKWGWNKEVVRSLSSERADTVIGFALLLFSFTLQLANLLIPVRWIDFEINKRVVPISMVVLAIIFGVAWFSSSKLQQKYYSRAEQIIQNKQK